MLTSLDSRSSLASRALVVLVVLGVVVAIGALGAGCPSPSTGGGDEGEGEGAAGEGEGAAAEGEGAGEGEGAALGSQCNTNADCASTVCGPFQIQPNQLADSCTLGCVQDADCAALGANSFCALVGVDLVCVKGCATNADCDALMGAGNGMCLDFGVKGDGCERASGPPCVREADCTQGTHCRYILGVASDNAFCIADAASGEVAGSTCSLDGQDAARNKLACRNDVDCPGGDVCSSNACVTPIDQQCTGRVCAEGKCASPCVGDADCPQDFRCEKFRKNSEVFGECEPFRGSALTCTKDADCTAPGEHCGIAQDPSTGDEITECRLPDDGDVDVNQRCNDDPSTPSVVEAHVGCASNFCSNDGTCKEICDQDGDCPAGDSCVKLTINGGANALGVCHVGARCTKNADCDVTTDFCNGETDFAGLERVCTVRRVGGLAPGDACDPTANHGTAFTGTVCFADSDCNAVVAGAVCNIADRSCFGPPDQICDLGCGRDSRCIELCSADADCADPNRICIGHPRTANSGDTNQTVVVEGQCLAVPGSRASCNKDADCTAAGEVCQAIPALVDGNVHGECAQPFPNGVALGAACDGTGAVFAECAEGLCVDTHNPTFVNGTCQPLCAVDGDCATGQTCHVVNDALGAGATAHVCQ
jgi:hypothetical protein